MHRYHSEGDWFTSFGAIEGTVMVTESDMDGFPTFGETRVYQNIVPLDGKATITADGEDLTNLKIDKVTWDTFEESLSRW